MSESRLTQTQPVHQITTFYIGTDLYGIDVMRVQEVTSPPVVVNVPLSPTFVLGLVNLRGQIATALGIREMFSLNETVRSSSMSVVCKMDGNLVSLLVDSIGDVVEVDQKQFEKIPNTVPIVIRQYLKGVYKMEGSLLSILDLDKISKELLRSIESTEVNLNNVIRREA